ncbi:hypothetical protein [Zobellia barbeyronii]|uniref:Uncharacterized protein n=1 Tax=Zobellia barbeyronii TaxID=2748009 RepID=A0ABS5WCU0_9FLAO|nr:hypothetical protein [Zobellia barbeyronii]MBT2161211.1 hypothetical protein [Zobellia barbeyronii]
MNYKLMLLVFLYEKSVLTVSFQFFSDNEVYLEGQDKVGKILWKTRYVKK